MNSLLITQPAPGLNKVAKLVVNCRRNDPAVVQAGGSPMLGFEFYIPDIAAESMASFVKTRLRKHKLPLLSITVEKGEFYLPNDQLWTRKKIDDCISKGL